MKYQIRVKFVNSIYPDKIIESFHTYPSKAVREIFACGVHYSYQNGVTNIVPPAQILTLHIEEIKPS